MRRNGTSGWLGRAGVLAALMAAWVACDGISRESEEKAMEKGERGAVDRPVVVMETSEGEIRIELWPDKAPATVENFLQYVDDGFYENTLFHRVIDGFMIQGGGFTQGMNPKEPREPVRNEASKELKNARGTLAMARTSQVHSATSQFFINLEDNEFLDHRDKTSKGFGYAVFGRVVEGMEVVDRIAKKKTAKAGPHGDVPVEPVTILKASRDGSS